MYEYPPKYKKMYGQNIITFTTKTKDFDLLLNELKKTLKNNKCVLGTSLLSSKWTMIWTSIERWYHQFDFSVSIYDKDNNPVVVFGILDYMDEYEKFIYLCNKIINDCKIINKDDHNMNIKKTIKIHEFKKEEYKKRIDNILKDSYDDYGIIDAREIVESCNGNNEIHKKNLNVLMNNYPEIVKYMLMSEKSIIIHACGQALLQIVLNNNIYSDMEDIKYEPILDTDLSIAIEYSNLILY